MSWQRLERLDQLGTIVERSASRPQLIFKHSTRCSISAAAKYRLEADLSALESGYDLYFLDLLTYRDLSRMVAERFGVHHESPQVIVVAQGMATFNASHYDIDPNELMELQRQANP